MKRLILMRHAKSSWSDPAASDHERMLNKRGQKNARSVGDWLRSHNLRPDHILCSDAERTRETLSRLNLGDIETTYSHGLYLAEPDVMFDALQAQSNDCILMVAHNPGCAMLAETLLDQAPQHPDFGNFPSGATLVVDFSISDWRDLRHDSGRAVQFTVPRDLTQ